MQHDLVTHVFMFVSCLQGPATCIDFRHTFALGITGGLRNEIHADKALHQFISHTLYVSCKQDLADLLFIIVLPKVTGHIFMLSNANE